jgi:hypothetical protein
MRRVIAALCFALATAPVAMAQAPAGDAGKKPARAAAEKPARAAAEKPLKREPTERQKAQQAKMNACSKEASAKKLKGDERKAFMSQCMKA